MNAFSKQKDVPISLFHQGSNFQAYDLLGTSSSKRKGVSGVVFRVWAPHAKSISVVGDFNSWNRASDPMNRLTEEGLWEVFVPGIKQGDIYQYHIEHKDGALSTKNDPYAFSFKEGKSAYCDISRFGWKDEDWMERRKLRKHHSSPLNIYEVHAPTWKVNEEGKPLNWRKLADALVPYVSEMGYTHIQLLPMMEHPESGENGDYDICGYFAPDSALGAPKDFMYLVNKCHQNNIGIILDWVPGHFPKNETGLMKFDGECCYEYEDDQWNSCIFDFSKGEVQEFLISNAMYWLEKYHVDGLRVDSVATIIYKEYTGEQRLFRRENAASVEFIKRMNSTILSAYPDVMLMAEENSGWPMVTKPTYTGGLGFHFKWNEGWDHDVLQYMSLDPFYRCYNHDKLTFGLMYAFTENHVLPLSHDDVMNGKGSLLHRLPGDHLQKFAGMRALLGYQMAHPGKKLSFMGNEFGQFVEWNEKEPVDWELLDFESHRKLQAFVKDLNSFYKGSKALWEIDNSWDGFQWLVHDDNNQNVLAFRRTDEEGDDVIAVCNFSTVQRNDYRIGVPQRQDYRIAINSDDVKYGGSGLNQPTMVCYEYNPMHGKPFSIVVDIPPMSVLLLAPAKEDKIFDAVISEA